MSNRKPILCVDFDGVIHQYDAPWKDVHIITDGPVKGALSWLLKAIDVFEVHIYSSRSSSEVGIKAMKEWLEYCANEEWPNDGLTCEHLMHSLIFAAKKPPAFLTIDDRAICFEGDWSKIDINELCKFKPWNKRKAVS